MTLLGEYLTKRSINRANVSRQTGISTTRLSELCNNSTTQLRVKELYLIATAMDISHFELLEWVCRDLVRKTRKPVIGPLAPKAEEPEVVPRRRRTRKRPKQRSRRALPKIALPPGKPSHAGTAKRTKRPKFR